MVKKFNKNTKMAILLPITSNEKYFPTHYLLEETKKIKGSVLCEHIRSVDYEERKLKFVEKINKKDFEYIIALFNACLK